MDNNLYTVRRKIDEGSFGDIFAIIRNTDSKEYAMKQIRYRNDFKKDPYIVSELQNLSRLVHPHIIALKDVLISSSAVNIIMELADGGNLENYIKVKGSIQETTIGEIYSKILQGVKFCHDNGIAHRDLTPSNILLTSHMDIRIADFGLSMLCRTKSGDVIMCHDFLGNTNYLAREVLQEIPHDPIPADIWTLGILLFFMIFLKLPFSGDERAIIEQHSHVQDIIKQQNSSRMFQTILLNILKIRPSRRPDISSVLDQWQVLCKQKDITGHVHRVTF